MPVAIEGGTISAQYASIVYSVCVRHGDRSLVTSMTAVVGNLMALYLRCSKSQLWSRRSELDAVR